MKSERVPSLRATTRCWRWTKTISQMRERSVSLRRLLRMS
ncbi:hypothetical protein GQ600_4454 [Phytophthora cactorum]|nr:hypothetical protein GQ600_4454 [Phytophthora cactorum]